MPNVLILDKPSVNVGLVAPTFTIPVAGLYNVRCQLTEIPPSGVSVVVTQNGTPVYTSPVLGETQSAEQFKAPLVCAASDAIIVTLSSGAAIDAALNSVKSIISIGSGL